jgi:hypothetical protein
MTNEKRNEAIKNLKQGSYFYATPDNWGDTYYLLKNDDQKARNLIQELIESGIDASLDELLTVYVENTLLEDDNTVTHCLTYSNGDNWRRTSFLNLNWA